MPLIDLPPAPALPKSSPDKREELDAAGPDLAQTKNGVGIGTSWVVRFFEICRSNRPLVSALIAGAHFRGGGRPWDGRQEGDMRNCR